MTGYSRSPKNPALQLLQKSSKSASTTTWRPIGNTFGKVAVRDFWENGCNRRVEQKTKASGGGGEGAGPAVGVAGTVQYQRRMRCVQSVWGERRAAKKSRGELVQ